MERPSFLLLGRSREYILFGTINCHISRIKNTFPRTIIYSGCQSFRVSLFFTALPGHPSFSALLLPPPYTSFPSSPKKKKKLIHLKIVSVLKTDEFFLVLKFLSFQYEILSYNLWQPFIVFFFLLNNLNCFSFFFFKQTKKFFYYVTLVVIIPFFFFNSFSSDQKVFLTFTSEKFLTKFGENNNNNNNITFRK